MQGDSNSPRLAVKSRVLYLISFAPLNTYATSLLVYLFQIELILNDEFSKGKFPEIQKSYLDLRKQRSPYRQALDFADFLEIEVIPKIRGKSSLYRVADEVVPERLLINLEKEFCLISYTILPYFQYDQTFYGGFYWDLNSLKKQIIPKVLEDITKDSGLHIQIVDERGRNIVSGEKELTPKTSLALSYRVFPLPWKLLVSQPEIKILERTARRENFFFGVFFTVIVALMLLGAVLIARDISRDSETTRLKTEFVHNISHELKTPLTLIRLFGETLQRKENLSNEEKNDCYEIIINASEDAEIANKYRQIIEQCQSARYASIEVNIDSGKTKDIIRLIRNIERKTKK